MYNGILNVYKEAGYTSFDVVAKLRGILHQKKIGHTGTLDPQAEGVLVVCLGKATRLCDILPDHDKEYEATLLLGVTTDTEDVTGTELSRQSVMVSEEVVRAAAASYVGRYEQIPPMYSAIKVNGRKLYELARQGETIARAPRSVTIYALEIRNIALPRVELRIRCSQGTYIRSLCRDIGETLGCGGCMERLVRTEACGFSIADSLRLEQIEVYEQSGGIGRFLTAIDAVYPDLPRIRLKPQGDKLIRNGNKFTEQQIDAVDGRPAPEAGRYRVYDSAMQFGGFYDYQPDTGEFRPYKMFI